MVKNETIHVRVNSDVKDNAEEILEMLGITVSDAINMFLCQVGLVGAIPFELKLPAPKSVIVRNEQELKAKLEKSQQDVLQGRTTSADEVYSRLEAKYGL